MRMALAANFQDVIQLFLRQGFGVLLTGAVFGGDLQRRGCSRRGFDVRPGDPLSFSAAATVLLAVTLVAGYIPVRRAMRVDPMVALRYE